MPRTRERPFVSSMVWPQSVLGHRRGVNADGVLQCAAGFFASHDAAQSALDHLFERQGLRPEQALLLTPDQASRQRFHRVSWRWTDRWPSEHAQAQWDRRICAAVGAWTAAMGALLWLLSSNAADAEIQLPLLAATTVAGALLGAGAHLLLTGPMRPQRFDRNVRRHLSEGCHAVIVHGVPARQQAEVMAVLRSRSQSWCTEALAVRPL